MQRDNVGTDYYVLGRVMVLPWYPRPQVLEASQDRRIIAAVYDNRL